MIAASVIAAALGAMGVGGGSVLMLYLAFAGYSQELMRGINLIFIIPVGIIGIYFHIKNGLIEKSSAPMLIIGGALGAAAGIITGRFLQSDTVKMLLSLLFTAIGIKELFTGIKMSFSKKNT